MAREDGPESENFGSNRGTGGSDFSDFAGGQNNQPQQDDGLQEIRDRIEKAEKMGVNVFGDSFVNTIAADMLGGSIKGFGSGYQFGGGNQQADDFLQNYATQYTDTGGNYFYNSPSSFLNTMMKNYAGGLPQNTLMENVYNQLVPGGATPLGVLANVPALAQNIPSPVATGISLGNMLMGKLGIGVGGNKDSDESDEPKDDDGSGYTIDAQGNYTYDNPAAFVDQMLGKFK